VRLRCRMLTRNR